MIIKKEEKEALNALLPICEMEQEKNYVSMSQFFDDLFTAFKYLIEIKEPDIVEASYTGLHLTENYREGDFYKMIDEFRNHRIIHAKYALKIINDALEKHKKFENIEKCNLKDSRLNQVIIAGDLHGSFRDLDYIIKKYDIPGKLYRFVFNGDYVDRGSQQCEVLLTLLYAFLLYPDRVFLNRGNHEDASLNLNKQFAPNFSDDCKKKYLQHGSIVLKKAHELFKYLPMATIVTNKADFKCFIVHGGVSEDMDLNFIESDKFKRYKFNSIARSKHKGKSKGYFCDLMWSDPMSNEGCLPNDRRGVGVLFGNDVSKKFCLKNKLNTIVRSHQVRSEGWSKDHEYCYTVFSCSNYCNGMNQGAVLILGQNDTEFQVHSFTTDETDIDLFHRQKDIFLSIFKTYLNNFSDELNELFKKADPQLKGTIRIKEWAHLVSKFLRSKQFHVKEKHLIELKDYLLPCDDKLDSAKYLQMFEKSINSSNENVYQLLDNIFSIIDIDHDGTITHSEAKKIISFMNLSLKTSYTTDFLKVMDKNKDGKIDVNEFRDSFADAFGFKKIRIK